MDSKSKNQIFCVECDSIKESKFCDKCKKETSNLFKISMFEMVKVEISLYIRHKRPEFGLVKKIFQGYKPSGDSKLPRGVDMLMIADREKNEWHHLVRDKITGEIIHEEHESLDQHHSK